MSEIEFAVRSSGKGTKVIRYNGQGLAEGIYGKRILRYFYGENQEQEAHEYAEKKVEKYSNADWVREDTDVNIKRLGER